MNRPPLIVPLAVWHFVSAGVFASQMVASLIMAPAITDIALESVPGFPGGVESLLPTIMGASIAFNVVFSLGLIAVTVLPGIGLLKLKPWGRVMAFVYGGLALAGASMALLGQLTTSVMTPNLYADVPLYDVNRWVTMAFAVISIPGEIFAIVYLTRPTVKAFFTRPAMTTPTRP